MKKIILILLTTFLFITKPVFAADLSVNCNESSCVLSPAGTALFSEKNLVPGQTIFKNIQVTNSNPGDECSLTLTVKNFQDDNHLGGVLATVINSGLTNYFSDNFTQLFFVKTVNLGVIPKSGYRSFDWIVTFNSAADNAYQSQKTKFDFDLSFSCGEVLGASTQNFSRWWALLILIFPLLWLLRKILSKMISNENR